MFTYLFAAELLAENSHNQSSEGLYFFGYLLCGLAILMAVGCFIMTNKRRNINNAREQKARY